MIYDATTTTEEFETVFRKCARALHRTSGSISVGQWHSRDVSGVDALRTDELANFSFRMALPRSRQAAQEQIKPNLPWADHHFQERVSGVPLNPPPSHEMWPWAHGESQEVDGHKFSHTYPERFWPKLANGGRWAEGSRIEAPHTGIRYDYGDLGDVVKLLEKHPLTRQAYLPVYFPEDTGTVHGARVPCSLGYHFMIRGDALSVTYYMRSCDFVRHFRDDVYFAALLGRWMIDELVPVHPRLHAGNLNIRIESLHSMVGDRYKIGEMIKSWDEA